MHTSLTRRSFLIGTFASLVISRDALAQNKLERTKVRISVGGKSALYYLPLTLAEQLGYFKEEGLDVEISDFAGGARALQAVVGGSSDVVSGAFEHVISMRAKHQDFRAFVLQGQAPQLVVMAHKDIGARYKSPKDLKGLKIGVSAPGSSTHQLVDHMLSSAGLKSSDVSIIGIGAGPGAVTAYTSRRIDVVSMAEPMITMMEQQVGGKIIADTRTMKGTQAVFGGPVLAASLYAPTDFIRKNPNTVQALTNAMVKALKWLQTASPNQVLATVPEAYLLGDKALYLTTLRNVREAFSPDGMFTDAGVRGTYQALGSANPEVLQVKVPANEFYTNEFVIRANRRPA